jgi:hypothetical protein
VEISRNSAVGAVCLFLLVAGIMFWTGTFWRTGLNLGSGGLPPAGADASDIASVEREVVIRKLTGVSVPDPATAAFGPVARDALKKALRQPDAEERRHMFKVIMSGLSLAEIGDAVAFLNGRIPGENRDELLFALLDRWGALDGRSAIAYATANTANRVRKEAIAAALTGWARDRPNDAWDWAVENPGNDPFESTSINAVVAQITAADPKSGFAFALAAPTEVNRVGALETVADHIFATGRREMALPWFADMLEGAVKQASLAYVARIWSRHEPVHAAEWIEGLPHGNGYHPALIAIAATWAVEDSPAAAQWAVSLPEGRGRANAVEAVFDAWVANGDVNRAAHWLNELPADVDFDRAVEKIAVTLMDQDPATAMTWADSILDDRLRDATTAVIGGRWMRDDPDGAAEFIDSTGISIPLPVVITEASGAQTMRPGGYEWTIQYQPEDGSAQGQFVTPEGVVELEPGAVVDIVREEN